MSRRRIIYPPIWLVIGLVVVFTLSEIWPGLKFTAIWAQALGSTLILLGLICLVIAAGLFKKAETDLVPFQNVTTLVTTGIYRYTRNPMYVGMVLVLLDCAFTVGALSALAVPFVFAAIIEVRFIRPEEVMLRELFGVEYEQYCSVVRRWL